MSKLKGINNREKLRLDKKTMPIVVLTIQYFETSRLRVLRRFVLGRRIRKLLNSEI